MSYVGEGPLHLALVVLPAAPRLTEAFPAARSCGPRRGGRETPGVVGGGADPLRLHDHLGHRRRVLAQASRVRGLHLEPLLRGLVVGQG